MECGHVLMFALIITLTFALVHLLQAQEQGFISFDCGLSPDDSPYIDPSTTLTFTSDVGYVKSGKNGRIQAYLEKNLTKQALTLRYFPEGRRSCYSLNVIRGTNYLIRATFVYGNYDGLNSYPNFDLYLGPNLWSSVDLEGKADGVAEEIIHIAKRSTLDVCLVKKGATTPMISGLELRPLRNDTYITRSGSLKNLFRVYLTNSDRFIRYPDDVHDRKWYPFFYKEWTQITTTLNLNASNKFELPQDAIKTAATPTNPSKPLTITWSLEPPTAQFYMYIHFAEIQTLRPNETREFVSVLNGKVFYGPYSPMMLLVNTLSFNFPKQCEGGQCVWQLVKTPNSTLPPLLNAIEIFTVIEFPQSETNQDDEDAIKNIEETYDLSRISWEGDPCVPKQLMWDGLNCSYADHSSAPRIISLNLSSSGLNRNILPHIQNLTALQELDLSNNSLTGEMPEFLANMKSLQVINLSQNNLSGSVPQALLDRQNQGLKLILQGNPKLLCHSVSCDNLDGNGGQHKRNITVPVVASVISAAILVAASVLFLVLRKKNSSSSDARGSSPNERTTDARSPHTSQLPIVTKNRKFSYSEVIQMTNNFKRVLGKGGFGVVYHAYVNDMEQVAVKVLAPSSSQGYKQFKAEVELLLRVHHKNLVSLVGYCEEGNKLALIYEYMSNGDLKEHLLGKRGSYILSWGTRLKIVAETAQGLEYLHNGCTPLMVHRDIKTTNILLDEHLQAKLADFGLSRSFPSEGETHVSTVVAGTPGYLDPEYYRTNWLTEKSDVYSFGVVLLEIITNRPVIDQSRERPHITDWVGLMLTKGDIKNVMDPKLNADYKINSVWKAVELAMSCVNPSSSRRPNMNQVLIELNECLAFENSGTSRDIDSKSSIEVSMTCSTEMTLSVNSDTA